MHAYSSCFLSRPVEESLRQTEDRLRLWHLQQQGSVAEFNYSFDSLSPNLDMPEDYLVDAYVFGLKEEIVESVKLFNPHTMLEAQRLARLYEIIVKMQAEKASKVSEIQESSRINEQSQTNHQDVLGYRHAKLLNIHEQNKFDSHNDGPIVDSSRPDTRVIANETTHRDVGNVTDRTKEVKAGLRDLELSTSTFLQATPKDKNANTADGVYGSLNLDSLEKFKGKLHEISSC